jgi:ABC-2 type transport system permease protein
VTRPAAEVLAQSLRDQRRALAGWSVCWVALLGLYCASWPAVRDNGSRFDDIAADLPAALRTVLSGPGGQLALGTPAGYVRAEVLSLTGPLLAVVLGLLLGSRAGAGEEDRGTLELLLAQPVSRRRVLLEQAGAVAVGLLGVFAVVAAALYGLGRLVDLQVGARDAVAVAVLLALLALEAAAFALLLGAATGQLGLARGATGVVAVLLFLVHGLAGSVPALSGVARLSPFSVVAAADPLGAGLSAGPVLALGLPALAFVALADVLFARRDVAFT